MNRVEAKLDAKVLLTAERYTAAFESGQFRIDEAESHPLLVVNQSEHHHVAALMTDLAPHWVGPLVDWGSNRVSAQAPQAQQVEVGDLFYQFVSQLIRWVGQLEKSL